MPYVPGDNWCICDLSGKKVLMSQTRKTWDGLRTHKDYWYPRHPQLDIKAVPDHMEVIDGRPRPADMFAVTEYGVGNIDLRSSDGVDWQLRVNDAGTLWTYPMTFVVDPISVYIGNYLVEVDGSGVISLSESDETGPDKWLMTSPDGSVYQITESGGSLTTTKL